MHWSGLMSVYVDDILVTGDETKMQFEERCRLFLKFGLCPQLNGLVLTKLSNTAASKFLKTPGAMDFIEEGAAYPHYKVAEDQEVEEDPDPTTSEKRKL